MNQSARLFAAALLLVLSGCESGSESGNEAVPAVTPPTQPPSATEQAPPPALAEQPEVPEMPAAPSDPYFALRPIDNSWPSGANDQTLAADLLAANFYLILDGSGSMAGSQCARGKSKMSVAKQAVSRFVEQIPAGANLGLFVFDQAGVSERVALQGNNRQALFDQIKRIQPGGDTPLATAITQGYIALTKQAVSQLGYGEYHLVVVTDGIASPGEDPAQIVQTLLEQSPVMLHTVGFCIDEQHALNQPGKVGYVAANSPEELLQGLQGVLAEAQNFSPDKF
ncbi:MAG: vWA domain-containing protein [Gammaproteobacteria bacterium]